MFSFLLLVLVQVRTLAPVLLRRLFANNFEEFWPQVPANIQNAVKEQILVLIQEEDTPAVRKKICDAAAELARNLIGRLFVVVKCIL